MIGTVLLALSVKARAQNYNLELQPKASRLSVFTASREDIRNQYLPSFSLDVAYFIKPKLGIGIYYSRSLFANGRIESTGTTNFFSDSDALMNFEPISAYHHYGIDIRVSTDRTSRFSIYGTAGLLKAEQLTNFHQFKVGRSGVGYSIGVGLVVKISRTICFNLFDARAIAYSKKFGFDREGSSYAFKVEAGPIFKFIRQR